MRPVRVRRLPSYLRHWAMSVDPFQHRAGCERLECRTSSHLTHVSAARGGPDGLHGWGLRCRVRVHAAAGTPRRSGDVQWARSVVLDRARGPPQVRLGRPRGDADVRRPCRPARQVPVDRPERGRRAPRLRRHPRRPTVRRKGCRRGPAVRVHLPLGSADVQSRRPTSRLRRRHPRGVPPHP
jgi:hypothetical protein